MKKEKGFTILSVVGAVGILLVLGIAVTSLGIFNVNFAMQTKVNNEASALAEAGVAEALVLLNQNNNWGLNKETIAKQLGEGKYTLTFDPGKEYYSVNNLSGDTAIEGFGNRSVPSNSALIFSTGISGGKKRIIEVLIHKPVFPYAVAVSGKLQSDGPLNVLGVKSLNDVEKCLNEGECNGDGNVFANGENKDEAIIKAGKDTYITGSAGATGNIDIKLPSTIKGGIYPNSTPISMPEVDPKKYDPIDILGKIDIIDNNISNLSVETVTRHKGDLVVNGPLELSNGFLYVTGNLEVNGAVTGTGAVVVEGNAVIKDGSSLNTSNKIALLAGNDVTLSGQNNYFNGLVMTKGDFTANQITIVGAFIVNNPDKATAGDVNLNGVKVVYTPEAVTQDYLVKSTGYEVVIGYLGGTKEGNNMHYFKYPGVPNCSDVAEKAGGIKRLAKGFCIDNSNSTGINTTGNPMLIIATRKSDGSLIYKNYEEKGYAFENAPPLGAFPLTKEEEWKPRFQPLLQSKYPPKGDERSRLMKQLKDVNYRGDVRIGGNPGKPTVTVKESLSLTNFSFSVDNKFIQEGMKLRVIYQREL